MHGWTRPDIVFAIGNVARFCSKPTLEQWVAAKHIFSVMVFNMQKNGDETAILTGYSDVDWEGNINDHKCSFRYLFVMIEQ